MKILVVAGGIVVGGVSRVVSLLSQEWQKQHDVSISLFRDDSNLAYPVGGKIVHKNIPLKGCQLSRIYYLYRLLKKQPFDKIISFSEDANFPLIIAAKLANVHDKVTLSVHNSVGTFSAKSMRRMTRFYPWANTIFAVSNAVREALIHYGLPADKVKTVLNPLDIKVIDRQALEPSAVTLAPACFNIISLGRLHPHKGFDLLISAFSLLAKKYPEAHLSIIGEGGQKQDLRHQIEQLALQEKVSLLGQLENPFPVLQQADVFVLASRLEGWGLALTEAMYLGLPVIAFDAPQNGPKEIITHNKNGLLAKHFEVMDLAGQMESLIKNPTLRTSLGQSARERALTFNVETVAAEWLR